MYQQHAAQSAAHSGQLKPAAYLYVRVNSAYNLRNTDTGLFGDKSDPYVVVRVGRQEKKTQTINNDLNPVWNSEVFSFSILEQDRLLELIVMNSNMMKDDCIGKLGIDLNRLESGPWHQKRERLQDANSRGGQGEIEYDIRIDRLTPQPMQSTNGAQQQRPPSPRRPQSPPRERQVEVPVATAAPDMSGNMFGQPNLFGRVPNLMGNVAVATQPGMQGLRTPSGANPAALGLEVPGTAAALGGRPLSMQSGRPLSMGELPTQMGAAAMFPGYTPGPSAAQPSYTPPPVAMPTAAMPTYGVIPGAYATPTAQPAVAPSMPTPCTTTTIPTYGAMPVTTNALNVTQPGTYNMGLPMASATPYQQGGFGQRRY